MIIVLQRVDSAFVEVNGERISEIGRGVVLFVCIEENDEEKEILYWSKKIPELRIFPDSNGRMNVSIKDIDAEILVISQFTLVSNLREGRRPGFQGSANPQKADAFINKFIEQLKESALSVKTGQFGAYMKIHLVNDGPVTFILR
jgi:D-tyrosyl-tRNA(Tyr) deacylase